MSVTIKQGTLQGTTRKSVLTGKEFYAFFGIPYAKPPVKSLRFQDPKPLESWDGVLDATQEKDQCIQKDMMITQQISGSEDCLYINVYTPEAPSRIKSPKAVLVNIHGGAFTMGSGGTKFYSPDFLINYDVILVSMNYRLHILGFLNLGLPECRGNAGLKDQVLALKWIKQNIREFGGDPENITLFGESAGAACVQYHMISPLTQNLDLFKRCILHSGNVLNVWAFQNSSIDTAFQVGQILGYQGTDKKELLNFLTNVPVYELTETVFKIITQINKEKPGKYIVFPFLPSIESIKGGAFLPDTPENLIKVAKPIPMIAGVNDQEGLMFFKDKEEALVKLLQYDFGIFVRYNIPLDENDVPEVTCKLKQFYFGNKLISSETLEQLIHLHSDFGFLETFYKSFECVPSPQPLYAFYFRCDTQLNLYKKLVTSTFVKPVKGACHGDDIGYLFHIAMVPGTPNYVDEDKKAINNICTLWTNFMKTGNPNDATINVQWNPTTPDQRSYLELGTDLEIKQGRIEEERISFWENHIHPVRK